MKKAIKDTILFTLISILLLGFINIVDALTMQGADSNTFQGSSVTFQGGGGDDDFSPSDISNLVAWWDAGVGITLNGGDVSDWADQSTEGNDLAQATASLQPLFIASDSTLNNQPSVQFDGTTSEELATAFANATTQPYFSVVVLRVIDNAGSGAHLIWGDSTSLSPYTATITTDFLWSGGGTLIRPTAPTTPYSTILSARYNAATGEGWALGVSQGTTSTFGSLVIDTLGIQIGNDNTGNRELNGNIAEMLFYDKDLSTSEHNDLGNYLADKYGLTWTDIT